MKSRSFLRRCLITLCFAAVGFGAGRSGFAAPTNLFFTNFDTNYNTALDLVGQNSWVGSGSGGNGIVSNFFSGQKQQAYVGFSPPEGTNNGLYVWQPINFNPVAAAQPLVKFSVLMKIADSDNDEYDYFRWSIYNMQGDRLFSIEFDNYMLEVNYQLNGNSPIVTNLAKFAPDQDYTLNVTMDFAYNRWSAMLGSTLFATNKPINTTSVPLDLGDIDAVWLVYDTNAPGNNYMLFDNYLVTAEGAQMQFLGQSTQGWPRLRTSGSNGTRWSVDATTNFVNWTPLITNNIISSGYFDYEDVTASPFRRRFYRARLVP